MHSDGPAEATGRSEAAVLWDRHATSDPLWAILSDPRKSGRQWSLEEVMRSGEREVALLMFELEKRGLSIARGLAVDFGCGVGRLTQALARRFERVVGLDISPEMLRLARTFNRYGGADYRLNDESTGLRALPGGVADLVYSNIVLQHIEPDLSTAFIAHFMRVAKPGGAIVFQIPAREVESGEVSVRPMSDDAYRATVSSACFPTHLEAGQQFALSLRIRNDGLATWRQAEIGSLRAGNHWLDASGSRMIVQDDGRATLPQILEPGESSEVLLECRAPAKPGAYVLEVDVVHEGITWFGERGSPTWRVPINVTPGGADIDRPAMIQELDPPAYEPGTLDRLLAPAPDPASLALSFPMYGLPKPDVLELVRMSGGTVVHIEDDGRAGPDWNSYRYFVVKEV